MSKSFCFFPFGVWSRLVLGVFGEAEGFLSFPLNLAEVPTQCRAGLLLLGTTATEDAGVVYALVLQVVARATSVGIDFV